MLERMWGEKNPYTMLVGMYTSTTIWRLLKKLDIDLPYDPAIPLLGIYPKECRLRLLHRHLNTHVYCSAIHNSQVMEMTKMPHY
jgi:hypothetical protein